MNSVSPSKFSGIERRSPITWLTCSVDFVLGSYYIRKKYLYRLLRMLLEPTPFLSSGGEEHSLSRILVKSKIGSTIHYIRHEYYNILVSEAIMVKEA